MAPLSGAALDKLVVGNNVFINSNCLTMARGGITIGDDVMLAANVQLPQTIMMSITEMYFSANRFTSRKGHG